jgi:hypothetical protein
MPLIDNEESTLMKTQVVVDKGHCSLILKHEPGGAFSVSLGARPFQPGIISGAAAHNGEK